MIVFSYLDTMRLDDDSMSLFGATLSKKKPEILFGHAHSLFELASFFERQGFQPPALRGIVSTSMMLLPSDRDVIERVFGVKVTNRYGCEEVGLIACECERHCGLHLNTDHVVVEFVDPSGLPVSPGQEGRILLTDLNNRAMPLVRYEVGDVGVPADSECACGRNAPVMAEISGRTSDYLLRRDHSRVSGISMVEKTLTAIDGLEQLQIVQEELTSFVLNVVASGAGQDRVIQELESAVREVFGTDIQLRTNLVSRLTQSSSGKYRFAICYV